MANWAGTIVRIPTERPESDRMNLDRGHEGQDE